MIRHIFWDWNGTLTDDAALLYEAVNTAMTAIGHPRVSAEPAAHSDPQPVLTADALAALQRWGAAGRTQSVLSRWPADDPLARVAATALLPYLDGIRGANWPEEPKEDMLRRELVLRKLDPAQALLIGDTDDDAAAARVVGAAVILRDAHSFAPIGSETTSAGECHVRSPCAPPSTWHSPGERAIALRMDRPLKEPDVSTMPDLPNTARCPVVHQFPFPRKSPVNISPELDRLRTHEPVCRVRMATGDEAWLVTRYDDVRFVLDDPRFSMKAASSDNAAELMPMVKLFPGLFSLDGAEHARSRQLLARSIRARDTQSFRSWLTKTTDELALDLLADNPPADLIVGFCELLVRRVACRLLGLTSEQLTEFRTHFRVITSVGGLTSAQFGAHWDALRSLVLGICDARRADPGDDMISDLIIGNTGERAIPEANLVGLMFSLIAALGHSPITQISYGLVTLLRHPDQWDLLTRSPELVHTATAEILRYGVAFEVEHVRVAKKDVEIGGVRIAPGDAVLTSIAAANRDETKFSDPTRFDITRADNDHLAFGHGPHVCAGSDLGTFMILSCLRSLCPLAPALRLAVPENDLFLLSENSHSYSLGAVPIRW